MRILHFTAEIYIFRDLQCDDGENVELLFFANLRLIAKIIGNLERESSDHVEDERSAIF